MGPMRLFVGVWLSETIQDTVMNYIDRSRREFLGWKWTKRQNLHFTLKFFGEVPEGRLNELSVALKTAAVQTHPFTLQLDNIGFFPKRGTPRIMWLGVGKGEPELVQLADSVERNCLEQGFGISDKPFQPHVTIARAKQEDIHTENTPLLVNSLLVNPLPVNPFGKSPDLSLSKLDFETKMSVCGFSLIESCLYPSGAVYKTIEDFKFEKSSKTS